MKNQLQASKSFESTAAVLDLEGRGAVGLFPGEYRQTAGLREK